MTQDEIIEMAKQAGKFKDGIFPEPWLPFFVDFANLVAQHEREEIAQFIEQTRLGSLPIEIALHYATLLGSYATAIRARGEA
jgi:hypothetical protein